MQCLLDGKSIIMEGMHLDPGLYLYEFARYSQAHLSERLSKRRSLRSPDLKSSVSEEQHAALRDSPSEDAAAALSGRDCSGDPFRQEQKPVPRSTSLRLAKVWCMSCKMLMCPMRCLFKKAAQHCADACFAAASSRSSRLSSSSCVLAMWAPGQNNLA